MAKNTGRRSFLKKLGVSSVTATVLPSSLLDREVKAATPHRSKKGIPANKKAGHEYNGTYSGEFLKRVAFPIGGLGSGMFCLEGAGAISHMSVRNNPDVFNEPGVFGAISVKNIKNGARIIEGPVPDWKSFGQPNTGNGAGGTIFGLPRFPKAEFLARFPFATITMEDEKFPLSAVIKGWSPFIPTDADSSSLPAGALEYSFKNNSAQPVDCVFFFS